jgi:hypothetical protein
MATINELTQATGITVVTEHDADVGIPVLSGMQRQGDVLVLPAAVAASTAVPVSGTAVVRAENGGNTHAVYAADGPAYCDTNAAEGLRVAALTVPDGSIAYLGHPEHGYLGIAPGSYEIRRQREMAGPARMVAD